MKAKKQVFMWKYRFDTWPDYMIYMVNKQAANHRHSHPSVGSPPPAPSADSTQVPRGENLEARNLTWQKRMENLAE